MNERAGSSRRVLGLGLLAGALAMLLVAAMGAMHRDMRVMAAQADSDVMSVGVKRLETPDAVCAGCHREIYERYERTAMARGSGVATDGMLPGSFRHEASGVEYRVFLRDGAAWMSFDRAATSAKGELSGERRLGYYIGSGQRGRTYLYEQGQQWFELPVNYYTRRAAWGMAPGYDDAERMPAALPVDPNCLHCHATEVQQSALTGRNRFATVPFQQGGVGCSACHGDATAHLAQQGHGPIVNPDKLNAARRDSACIQCHLEGDAVVYRPGRSLAQFKAGDDLADVAVYFVRASQLNGGARATSQYEALLRSACKRASGDKLTCTTCHDPHYDPTPAERVQYFRAKCLNCHTGEAMKLHHAEQKDCATCHMPSRSTTDISHEQVTDHDVEARPVERFARAAVGDEMVPVGVAAAGDREFGLAYAQVAQHGDGVAAARALKLLSKAAASGADDEELQVRLGYLEQVARQPEAARKAYIKALAANPYGPAALANLAVMDAGAGRVDEAVRLLQRLVDVDPSQAAAGLNLAFIECSVGRPKAALELTQRLLAVNPDDAALREFARSGAYAGQSCSLHPMP